MLIIRGIAINGDKDISMIITVEAIGVFVVAVKKAPIPTRTKAPRKFDIPMIIAKRAPIIAPHTSEGAKTPPEMPEPTQIPHANIFPRSKVSRINTGSSTIAIVSMVSYPNLAIVQENFKQLISTI